MLVCCLAGAQTQPEVWQIRNLDQVRICYPLPTNPGSDPRPGTLVSSCQIKDGRQKLPSPDNMTDQNGNPADAGVPTVCIVNWLRWTWLDTGVGHNFLSHNCFTQFGLALLLMDPAWLAWWNAH